MARLREIALAMMVLFGVNWYGEVRALRIQNTAYLQCYERAKLLFRDGYNHLS